MLVLQSQVGSANVARPSQKVLLNILAHLPTEYFTLEGKINAHALASGAFYPFVEVRNTVSKTPVVGEATASVTRHCTGSTNCSAFELRAPPFTLHAGGLYTSALHCR